MNDDGNILNIGRNFSGSDWCTWTYNGQPEEEEHVQADFIAASGALMRTWKSGDDKVQWPLACLLALRSAWRLVNYWNKSGK